MTKLICSSFCRRVWLGIIFSFSASFAGAQESVYPDNYDVTSGYSVSSHMIQVGELLTVTRTISNRESFPLANLYMSESLPEDLVIESYSVTINGIEVPARFYESAVPGAIPGYRPYYWLIDEPDSEDILNRRLLPGETLRVEYYLSCTTAGSYSLPFHTTCFAGNDIGFFAAGSDVPVAFLTDPGCGDINDDLKIDILDVVYIINHIYKDGPPPDNLVSSDVNSDGDTNILDIVYLVNFLYKKGPVPNCPSSSEF